MRRKTSETTHNRFQQFVFFRGKKTDRQQKKKEVTLKTRIDKNEKKEPAQEMLRMNTYIKI